MTTDGASLSSSATVLGGDLGVLAVVAVVGAGGALVAEPAGDDGDERAVHRRAHDVGEVGTGGADQRAGDDQQVVAQQEARGGGRPAGVAVEHRDDDRHVAAADRGDQVPAQGEREHGDDREQQQVRLDHEHHGEDGEGDQRAQVERVVGRQHQRVGLDPRRQLEERDDRAGEGDRADEDADHDLGGVDAEQVAGDLGLLVEVRLDREVAVPADQDGGEADEAVQDRDQLGHAGHLDPPGPPQADRGADDHGDDQQRQRRRRRCCGWPGRWSRPARSPCRRCRRCCRPSRSRAWTARPGSG